MNAPRRIRAILVPCLAAALVASCGTPSVDRKKEAAARMRMGVTYLDQSNLHMAMTELSRAAELDPTNPEVDMMLGLTYRARGDQAKAEEYLRSAIARNPDYADARNNLGIVLAGRKAWDEAIREFEAAAGNVLYATPEWAFYNAGEAYRLKGDASMAHASYRKAIRVNDRYAPAYLGLSVVLGGADRWEDAADALARCVERVPDYVDGWMELGRVQARLKRTADAVKSFKTVLELSREPGIRKQAVGYLAVLESEKR
ncbi:MAG: tetratricopeptide repeat protein [Deltaproteobacteria bacterium]|nr:MAG: tetratricopeptide repeat protein [Deltaproteobacteria bacterium]